MKIILTMATLALSLQSLAGQNVQNNFWSVPVPQNLSLKIIPISLNDCSDYQKFVDENLKSLTPEDLDFARKLPIKGQMKDFYQSDFLIKNEEIKSDKGLVFIALNDKIKISASASQVGLSYLSRTLGLEIPQVETLIQKNNEILLRVYSRDLACDILKNKIELSTSADIEVAPLPEEQLKISKFYNLVAEKTLEVMNSEEGDYVKAAQLGIEYLKINKDIRPSLSWLFNNLFKPNSLELNANWSDFAGSKIINFPKSQNAGTHNIKFKVVNL